MARTYKVTIKNVDRTLECAADRTILQAAIGAGIDYPFACATGNCATCISKLDSGKVLLLPHSDASLRKEQIKAGQTLACRAQPRSDVTITWMARTLA
jgi:CDP-4-dehydro-6-deoxyglucose reductase/ferredoxin-NAD(P)+ reductase (naphthalene dioxygenase ferredoxin-specific)